MKKIILILASLLLVLPIASALDTSQLILWWKPTGAVTADSSIYARTGTHNGGVTSISSNKFLGDNSGYFSGSTDDPLVFTSDTHLQNMVNWTYCIWFNNTAVSGSGRGLAGNTREGWDKGDFALHKSDGGNQIFYFANINEGTTNAQAAFTNVAPWELLCAQLNITGGTAYQYLWRNKTVIANNSFAYAWASPAGNFTIGSYGATDGGIANWIGGMDEASFWNSSRGGLVQDIYDQGVAGLELDQATDTTPPSITYYNLTVGNGCESWNTNKNIACNTSLERPTAQFNTSKNAWCAISGNTSSTPGINYTEMGTSLQCNGTISGEGTKEHFCTLPEQDELFYETSYIYISCRDANYNMNKSGESTSGSLKVNVTSLDASAKDSIDLGARNSLSSGYATYSDQKIYARNSANSQQLGTFDKVVKKLNKIWAFNRIGIFDSHVNMMNITPVLYTLELANKTASNITQEVELLINSTK